MFSAGADGQGLRDYCRACVRALVFPGSSAGQLAGGATASGAARGDLYSGDGGVFAAVYHRPAGPLPHDAALCPKLGIQRLDLSFAALAGLPGQHRSDTANPGGIMVGRPGGHPDRSLAWALGSPQGDGPYVDAVSDLDAAGLSVVRALAAGVAAAGMELQYVGIFMDGAA